MAGPCKPRHTPVPLEEVRFFALQLVKLPGEKWGRAEAAKLDSALHKCRYAGFKKMSKICYDGLSPASI